MTPKLFSLEGRIVLITGASRGLGWAMAKAMAEAGAHVVLNGRSRETLEARANELGAAGHEASVLAFDVSDFDAAAEAVASVAKSHGRLDVLLNNAGVQHRRAIADFATEDWQRVIETNLSACFVLAREAARVMAPRGFGRIINVASIMGLIARPGLAAYVAAKGGLASLTKALAVELGPEGVTVNAIAPGFFATEMNADLVADADFTAFVRERTPLSRWGRVEELGGAAVFLASDAASYVNGHVLVVDGGISVAL